MTELQWANKEELTFEDFRNLIEEYGDPEEEEAKDQEDFRTPEQIAEFEANRVMFNG